MHRVFGIVAIFVFLGTTMFIDSEAEAQGQTTSYEISVAGTPRHYIVYEPATAEAKGLPLMIVLHGGLGNAEYMERTSGMDEVAAAGPFLVAYPDGTGGRIQAMKNRRTWNAGRCCGQAVKQDANDVAFMTKMIDDIRERYGIDTRRVYVAGHSNGAMLAYRLACEIPDKIAAVIAVSGTVAVDDCDRAKDVPVLHIHGDQDRNVPFNGGMGEASLAGVAHRSVPDSMKLLTRARACSGADHKTLNNDIEVSNYRCTGGAPVELYILKGGAHAWPGGTGKTDVPAVDRAVSASRLAWEFAKQFRKP